MSIFPTIKNSNEIPEDGEVFRTPELCKKVFGDKCISYYKSILKTEGLHHCPFGFSSYVKENRVSTGLLIKDKKNKSLGSRNFSEEDFTAHLKERELIFQLLREIKKKSFKQIQNKLEDTNLIKEPEPIVKYTSSEKGKEFVLPIETLDNTIHELRKLNKTLKSTSRSLRDASGGWKPNVDVIKDKSHIIYSTSSLISIRLDTYDFLTNPELVTGFHPSPVRIYRKFEKSMHVLRNQAFEKGINVKFEGKSGNSFYGYSIFEILPFILFENAIKHGVEDSEVICKFSEDSISETVISIHNIGCVPEKSEEEQLKERSYRGKHTKDKGSGIGLYLVSEICKIHDISFEVKYSMPFEEDDPDRIGNFYVNLRIPCS